MSLFIYKKDDSGLVTSIGKSGFNNKNDAYMYYSGLDDAACGLPSNHIEMPTPYVEPMLGWSHSRCEWWGSIGFGLE